MDRCKFFKVYLGYDLFWHYRPIILYTNVLTCAKKCITIEKCTRLFEEVQEVKQEKRYMYFKFPAELLKDLERYSFCNNKE